MEIGCRKYTVIFNITLKRNQVRHMFMFHCFSIFTSEVKYHRLWYTLYIYYILHKIYLFIYLFTGWYSLSYHDEHMKIVMKTALSLRKEKESNDVAKKYRYQKWNIIRALFKMSDSLTLKGVRVFFLKRNQLFLKFICNLANLHKNDV